VKIGTQDGLRTYTDTPHARLQLVRCVSMHVDHEFGQMAGRAWTSLAVKHYGVVLAQPGVTQEMGTRWWRMRAMRDVLVLVVETPNLAEVLSRGDTLLLQATMPKGLREIKTNARRIGPLTLALQFALHAGAAPVSPTHNVGVLMHALITAMLAPYAEMGHPDFDEDQPLCGMAPLVWSGTHNAYHLRFGQELATRIPLLC